MIDIKKALDTSTGADVIPEKLDKELVDVVKKTNELRVLIPPMTWSTLVYSWVVRKGLVSAQAYDENDTFNGTQSGYERRNVQIKMIKAEGAVSNLLKATSVDFINALQEEVNSATVALANEEARLDIQGDSATNPKEYDGLIKQCTYTLDAENKAFTLDLLDEAIEEVRAAGGVPNLIIMHPKDYSYLKKLCKDTYRLDWADIGKDHSIPKYDNIRISINPYIPGDPDAATPTYRTILVLDTRYIKRPTVRDVKYTPVEAPTDSTAFRINEYLALAVKAAELQRAIINVGNPA